jgi:hypothetical protein
MNMRLTDTPGILKDLQTGAVINTNIGEYKMLLEQRTRRREMAKMQSDLAYITKELEEVKNLLAQITTGKY